MRYILTIIVISTIVLLISCSDSTEPTQEEFTILKEIQMEGYESWKIIKTSDSCIVIGGKKDNKPGLMKLDIDGNKIWEAHTDTEVRTFYMSNLEETPCGNFLISGSLPLGDAYIAKYDMNGILIWEKTFGPYISNDAYIKAVENSQNETTIVSRRAVSKYDSNGDIIWGHYFYEDFCYSYDDVDFEVWDVYDCGITPDDQVIVIYKSLISDLVMMVIDSDGNIEWGDYYYIDIETNAKLIINGNYHYIVGSYKDVDRNEYLFSYRNYNYLDGVNPYSTSFEEIGNFYDYIISAKISSSGTILITPMNKEFVISLSDIQNYAWTYNLEDIESLERIYDTIEIDNDKYALIAYKDLVEGDSVNYGTYLRFFQKN